MRAATPGSEPSRTASNACWASSTSKTLRAAGDVLDRQSAVPEGDAVAHEELVAVGAPGDDRVRHRADQIGVTEPVDPCDPAHRRLSPRADDHSCSALTRTPAAPGAHALTSRKPG
jgi:hypothetical protein